MRNLFWNLCSLMLFAWWVVDTLDFLNDLFSGYYVSTARPLPWLALITAIIITVNRVIFARKSKKMNDKTI